MSKTIIADRYAKAYLKSAEADKSGLREELKVLEYIVGLFKIPDVQKVLTSPVMPGDLKKQLLEFAHAKCNKTPRISGFIDVVVKSKRVEVLPEIVTALAVLIDEQDGIYNAQVTSALKLNEDEVSEVKQNLEKLLNKKLRLHQEVDPSLLGGFVVKVGNQLLDLSIKTKLDELSESAAT